MLVINRFRRGARIETDLRSGLEEALAALSEQRGFLDGHVGRNVDDPDLWVLQTRWQGPGAYRRALSAYDVKLRAWEHMVHALDEPSAYEIVQPGEEPNRPEPRGAG
jgi:hypothetical protein